MIDRDSVENELAIQDRVLVEADLRDRPISFRAVIVRVCPTELWLGLASPDRRLETMRPNQKIRLSVARNSAALLGQSDFLRPLGDSKSRVFAVARPTVLERVQRRGYVRYPIDLPIYFRHVDPATWEPRGKAASTVTRNLSPGRLLFVSNAAVSVGDDLDLTLPLSGGDRVSMNGVVRRLGRGTDDGESGPHGQPNHAEVAVMFTRITSLDQDRIVRLILLTEHRRREAATAGMPL
ncbi:MAG: PilZ domain-containing protein [Candidatus Limnocylindrales bacterium]